MADLDLRVDYQDDILDSSVNTKRKYNIIENEDGTKSLEDVSVYTQNGDSFGAADINKTNQAVLDLNSSLTVDTSDLSDGYSLNNLLQLLAEKYFPKWNGYLFENGNKYTDITGGWSGNGWSISGANYSLTSGTFSGINMCFEGIGYLQGQLLATVNKIDLTNYNTLKFNISEIVTGGDMAGIVFITTTKVAPGSGDQIILSSSGLNEIDLSSYNGDYYVGFSAINRQDRSMKIDEVWLE